MTIAPPDPPTLHLAFGYGRGIPVGITTAWGARLIAPRDLLPDRQDLKAESDEAKAALIAWLNGSPPGTGAIDKALSEIERQYDKYGTGTGAICGSEDKEHLLYEDDQGKVVGNTNGSCGYVYVAGWLK